VLGAVVGIGLALRPAAPPATPSASASSAVVPTPSNVSSPELTPTPSASPTVAPSPTLSPPPPRAPGDYLLLTRAELMALPTSGPAWDELLSFADGDYGVANLSDQDSHHDVSTFGAALVYARTGDATYRERARDGVMAAIGTEREGATNSILALGRQLGAYVLAADLIDLSGDDDARFRAWLTDIRTRSLGGHGRWTSLVGTHEDSANNWGAFAGASRIAAGLYLGDTADVAKAAQVLRGFLGDKAAWDRFQPVEGSASWACEPNSYVPLNPPCVRGGIDLDGAIVRDIDRGGNRKWPPGRDGVGYTLEALQGLSVQAELLTENGWGDAWHWSADALRRAADLVTRSGEAGGRTWNRSEVSYHLPWLFNARYGLDLPTRPAGQGRIFGYTDWLYGS
jgi:Alginate lyase